MIEYFQQKALLQFYCRYDSIVINTKSKMKKKQDNKNSAALEKPAKRYKFYLGSRQRFILIACDFDSGNIQLVKQISQFQYRLASVHDGTNTDHRVNSKSWFYFSVTGFPKNTKGKFFITKVQTLSSMYYSKYNKSYRPVYRIGEDGPWERIPTQCLLVMRQDNQLQCVFQHLFKDQSQKVYFAFCYPFSYTENKKYIDSLSEYIYNDNFYFHKEVLIKSLEGRDVHLLTITSYDLPDKVNEHEQVFNQNLFPQRVRPQRFTKPVVLISARVHPGESSSSYAVKGVIDFLMNKEDLRAKLLRKMFVFMIIPMINVDGVYHGHFRMDIEGKNLNRHYLKPSLEKHPSIYAIKQLANHLNNENRLSFYFDLHAHNAKKGHFIYGNAINDFVEQVQSQVFCKIISMNNKGFQYEHCNFSQKHMNAKDKNQDLTKEGCGRVVMHRLAKIIHSYSVQCGIVSPNKVNMLPDLPNVEFKLGQTGISLDKTEDNSHEMYRCKNQQNSLFTIQMYENLGKSLMVSILDVFDKNPYNRVYSSKYKSMDMLRRLTAFQIFHEAQRFRMFERFVFCKVKNINQLIREVLNTKLHYKKLYNFYFFDDKQLKNTEWPENIPGLAKPRIQSPTKIKKYKSIDSHVSQITQSFLKALKGQFDFQNAEDINKESEEPEITQEQISEEEDLKSEGDKSSETQNFEETQNKIQADFVETIEAKETNTIVIEEVIQRKDFSFSPIRKQVSRSQITLERQRQGRQISASLYLAVEDPEPFIGGDKRKQNASHRVRRMIRQQFTSGNFGSEYDIIDKKKNSASILATTDSPTRRQIYDSFRHQVKQKLYKQQDKDKERKKGSGVMKICSPVKIQKERIKSFTAKKSQNTQSRKGLQLPALGSQMYIITTSTKIFMKKN